MALSLTDAQKQRFSQHFVVAGVRAGLSANAIQKNLQAVGLGYRRENLLADVARYQNVPARMPRLTQAEFSKYLAPNLTIKMPTTGGTRYQYAFTITATNINTGDTTDITYSVVSPTRLTPEIASAYAQTTVDFGASNLQPDYGSLALLGETQFYSELP